MRWRVFPMALSMFALFGGAESVCPAQQAPTPAFDVKSATDAYLAKIPPEKKARSDAYFEGGYWLLLWNFLYGAGVALLLLHLRWSARMRNFAERLTRRKPLQTFVYWVQYLFLTGLVTFPLTLYQNFFREHKYGLATQTFGLWLGDQLKGLLVTLVLGGLFAMALFGIIRRLERTWWIWGAFAAILFSIFVNAIAPVFIAPLFNTYTKLQDEKIKGPILSLARANGIAANDVYQVNASRQTTRISANVSGLFGTERITLNDNLLKRCSLPEVEAVTGHEMGHYVLNHVYKGIVYSAVFAVLLFVYLRWAVDWALRRWGVRWEVRGMGDLAVIPLLFLLISLFFFVLTPVRNTVIRTMEYEADIFGLNAARQPDGFAEVALKLGEYRKLAPTPLEEFIFYDHPSGRTRIFSAMRWKAENLPK